MKQSYSVTEIARHVSTSDRAVRYWLRQAGIKPTTTVGHAGLYPAFVLAAAKKHFGKGTR